MLPAGVTTLPPNTTVPLFLPTTENAVAALRDAPALTVAPSYWMTDAPAAPPPSLPPATMPPTLPPATTPPPPRTGVVYKAFQAAGQAAARARDTLRRRPSKGAGRPFKDTGRPSKDTVTESTQTGGGTDGIESFASMPKVPDTATPPAGAIVGRSLSDFRWVDSQVVPRGKGPEIPNIRQMAPGVFAHVLRWRSGWHDGDRHLTTGSYAQKGRAELCCLGGNQPFTEGSTWLIGTTVRLHPRVSGASSFIDLAQPILHQSYFVVRGSGDSYTGSLMAFTRGLGSQSKAVRTIQMKRGVWYSLVFKVTLTKNGSYGMSVNGDAFQTITGIDGTAGHTRSSHGGTFGLYMKNGRGDCIVYHAFPWIKKVG